MSQTFYPYRLAQNITSVSNKRVNPRWMPKLLFCVDVERAVPNVNIGAPGMTYRDWGPNAYTVQVTYTSSSTHLPQFDGFGYNDAYTSSSDGAKAISLLLSNVTPSTGLSMSVWYRVDAFGNYNGALMRGIGGNSYDIVHDSGGTLYYQVPNGAEQTFSPGAGQVVAGRWYHYALVWDGTTLFGYLNGALLGKTAVSGTPANGNNGIWQISGCFDNTGNTQPGAAREAMVWNDRYLTAEEVYKLYTEGPFEEGPVGPSILSYMPASYFPPTPSPAAPAGPFIKVRHGGTSHGATVRTVNSDFTVNYDDFFIEATGDIAGFLFPWESKWQNREIVIKNVGTSGTTTIYCYDSGNIDSVTSLTISPGDTKRFIAGSSSWRVW